MYQDLIAHDAKYHRTCYGHYLSEKSLNAASNSSASSVPSVHEDMTTDVKAFTYVIDYVKEEVLYEKHDIVTWNELTAIYLEKIDVFQEEKSWQIIFLQNLPATKITL